MLLLLGCFCLGGLISILVELLLNEKDLEEGMFLPFVHPIYFKTGHGFLEIL